MKVAELYAELGIQVKDPQKITDFENALSRMAASAQAIVAALKQLSAIHIPSQLRVTTTTGGGTTTATAKAATPKAVSGPGWSIVPNNPNFIGPMPASSQPQQSVWNGLKSLAMLGLKVTGITSVAVAIKKLVSALTEWMQNSMKAAVGTQLFTRRTGQTQETLKQWELASRQMGLAQDEAAANLEAITQKQREIAYTGEGVAPFSILGLPAGASPTQIFEAFRKRTAGMTGADAVFFGKQVGFSAEWSAFLHSFKGALPEIRHLLPSQGDLDTITRLNGAWEKLKMTMDLLGQKTLAQITPGLEGVLNFVTKLGELFNRFPGFLPGAASGSLLFPGMPVGTVAGALYGGFKNASGTSVNINAPVTVNATNAQGVEKKLRSHFEDMVNQTAYKAYYQRTPAQSP